MMADLFFADYGWTRQEVWWDTPFTELISYFGALVRRRIAEAGGTDGDAPVTDDMVALHAVIEQVKAEKRR